MYQFFSDMFNRTSEFRLGEEFQTTWGRNDGVMFSVCTFELNVLYCTSEERVKQWNFEVTYVFSPRGMINER